MDLRDEPLRSHIEGVPRLGEEVFGRSRRIAPTSLANRTVTGSRSAKRAEFQFILVRVSTSLSSSPALVSPMWSVIWTGEGTWP